MTEQQFEENVSRIVKGDKDGLKEIYQEYIAYIYSTVYSMVNNKENAEDITSEFFIKFFRIAGEYKPGNGHKGWMATIARNMALDFLRKNKREILTDEIQEQAADHEVEKTVVGEIGMEQALAVLNESEKEIVNHKIIGELTFKEIAEIMQLPMGTVTWKYRTAIEKVRRCGYE